MTDNNFPESLVDATAEAIAAEPSERTYQNVARAATVAVLRALAGPDHGRDNHVLMTGNMFHWCADQLEGKR